MERKCAKGKFGILHPSCGHSCRVNVLAYHRPAIYVCLPSQLLQLPTQLSLIFSLSFSYQTNSQSPNFLALQVQPSKYPASEYPSSPVMKKPGFLAASVAAASATALSATSSSSSFVSDSTMRFSHQVAGSERNQEKSSASTEKFAPKFDGLRFIETLVTAHR